MHILLQGDVLASLTVKQCSFQNLQYVPEHTDIKVKDVLDAVTLESRIDLRGTLVFKDSSTRSQFR